MFKIQLWCLFLFVVCCLSPFEARVSVVVFGEEGAFGSEEFHGLLWFFLCPSY